MTMQTAEFAKLDVMARAEEIQARLHQNDENLGTHLEAIRQTLLKYEELVHILPDTVISTYMAGMQKFKNIKLLEEATKTRGPRKSKSTLDDF